MCVLLEAVLARPQVQLLDVGPLMGGLKAGVGCRPLHLRSTLRCALFK
jgi:hypothetical protein